MNPTEITTPPYVCPHCRLGHLQPGTAFYCRRIAGTLLTVPDFPAWICDVCANREYDQAALADLYNALGARPDRRGPRRPGRDAAGEVAQLGSSGQTE